MSMQKYPNVSESRQKYPKVSKSIKKYSKVSWRENSNETFLMIFNTLCRLSSCI